MSIRDEMLASCRAGVHGGFRLSDAACPLSLDGWRARAEAKLAEATEQADAANQIVAADYQETKSLRAALAAAESREKALRGALMGYRASQQHRGCECPACVEADFALAGKTLCAAPAETLNADMLEALRAVLRSHDPTYMPHVPRGERVLSAVRAAIVKADARAALAAGKETAQP